jgi:hypothetical protein
MSSPVSKPLLSTESISSPILNSFQLYRSLPANGWAATANLWLVTVTCWSNSLRSECDYMAEHPQKLSEEEIVTAVRQTLFKHILYDRVEVTVHSPERIYENEYKHWGVGRTLSDPGAA